jgi:hypothetical protein
MTELSTFFNQQNLGQQFWGIFRFFCTKLLQALKKPEALAQNMGKTRFIQLLIFR